MTTESLPVLAILGGTGDLGTGLARRWAQAGYQVIIGSRTQEKAEAAVADLLNVKTAEVRRHDLTLARTRNVRLVGLSRHGEPKPRCHVAAQSQLYRTVEWRRSYCHPANPSGRWLDSLAGHHRFWRV